MQGCFKTLNGVRTWARDSDGGSCIHSPGYLSCIRHPCTNKGSLYFQKAMNFRKIFERPLTPPPAPFSEKNVAIFFQTGPNRTKFATKFFRSEMTPSLYDVFPENHDQNWRFFSKKKRNEIFWIGNDPPPLPPPPPFRKLSANSSVLVNRGFP